MYFGLSLDYVDKVKDETMFENDSESTWSHLYEESLKTAFSSPELVFAVTFLPHLAKGTRGA